MEMDEFEGLGTGATFNFVFSSSSLFRDIHTSFIPSHVINPLPRRRNEFNHMTTIELM